MLRVRPVTAWRGMCPASFVLIFTIMTVQCCDGVHTCQVGLQLGALLCQLGVVGLQLRAPLPQRQLQARGSLRGTIHAPCLQVLDSAQYLPPKHVSLMITSDGQ